MLGFSFEAGQFRKGWCKLAGMAFISCAKVLPFLAVGNFPVKLVSLDHHVIVDLLNCDPKVLLYVGQILRLVVVNTATSIVSQPRIVTITTSRFAPLAVKPDLFRTRLQ